MPWPAESLLGRLDAAIAWFLGRVPMTPPEREELEAKAREHGFWVAGTNVLGEVTRIQQSLATALENGSTFDQWKAAAPNFAEVSSGHAQTVYRNATQSSYNRGRMTQLRKPTIAKARPYWQFVAIHDSRTTNLCTELDGTILPADDPRWETLLPPRHHNCRSTIRALRPSEAEKRGGVTAIPDVEFPPGWGPAPVGAELAAGYPDDLVAILEKKPR